MGLFDFRKYETTFGGKDISMEVRPLKTKEMGRVLPFMLDLEKYKDSVEVEILEDGRKKYKVKDASLIQSLYALQGEAFFILPNAVRELKGIDDDWKTVTEEFAYFTFVLDLMMHLVMITQISEGDLKNSAAPSS